MGTLYVLSPLALVLRKVISYNVSVFQVAKVNNKIFLPTLGLSRENSWKVVTANTYSHLLGHQVPYGDVFYYHPLLQVQKQVQKDGVISPRSQPFTAIP